MRWEPHSRLRGASSAAAGRTRGGDRPPGMGLVCGEGPGPRAAPGQSWWAPCRGLQRAAPATPSGHQEVPGAGGRRAAGGQRDPKRVPSQERGAGALRGPGPGLLSQRPALQTPLSHFTDGHTEAERSCDRPGQAVAPEAGQTPREARGQGWSGGGGDSCPQRTAPPPASAGGGGAGGAGKPHVQSEGQGHSLGKLGTRKGRPPSGPATDAHVAPSEPRWLPPGGGREEPENRAVLAVRTCERENRRERTEGRRRRLGPRPLARRADPRRAGALLSAGLSRHHSARRWHFLGHLPRTVAPSTSPCARPGHSGDTIAGAARPGKAMEPLPHKDNGK